MQLFVLQQQTPTLNGAAAVVGFLGGSLTWTLPVVGWIRPSRNVWVVSLVIVSCLRSISTKQGMMGNDLKKMHSLMRSFWLCLDKVQKCIRVDIYRGQPGVTSKWCRCGWRWVLWLLCFLADTKTEKEVAEETGNERKQRYEDNRMMVWHFLSCEVSGFHSQQQHGNTALVLETQLSALMFFQFGWSVHKTARESQNTHDDLSV